MQPGPRMVMPASSHMQHPGMTAPMDAAAMQQQVAAMNGAGGRMVGYDTQNMTDEARAFLLEQQQQQQQATMRLQQQQIREKQMASQRALGVGVGVPQAGQAPQHLMQPHVQAMMQNQGIRQVQTQNGVVFIDAQGRPISIPAGWQQNDPRQPPAGVNQAQMQAYYQQQQVQAQAQHAAAQQQIQHQQMLPPQQALHYQRQQQQLAQQAQQRGSQPPSARPPNALPPQIAQGQSPALLQVPPPPSIKRTASRATSRSTSPIPPHLRPPPPALPMQSSASAMPSTGNQQPVLPLRATTLPLQVASAEGASAPVQSQNFHAPLVNNGGPSFPPASTGQIAPAPTVFPGRIARASKIKRWENKTSVLQRMVDQAQAALGRAQKEAEEAKQTPEVNVEPEDHQATLNTAVLDYLERAGFSTAAQALKADIRQSSSSSGPPSRGVSDGRDQGSSKPLSSGDTDVKSKEEVNTGMNGSGTPSSLKEPPSGTATSEVKNGTEAATDSKELKASSPDSIFGETEKETETPSGTHEEAKNLEEDAEMKVETPPKTASAPAQPDLLGHRTAMDQESGVRDLGELFTWWVIFEDTKRLATKRKLGRTQTPAPITETAAAATVPSSAIAARIATAAPAAALRAAGEPPQSAGSGEPVQLTAQLQRADAMRDAQAAQIIAQQAASRRTPSQDDSEHRQPYMVDGVQHMLTQDEVKRLYQRQQQIFSHRRQLQTQQPGQEDYQQQMLMQMQADGQGAMAVTTPGVAGQQQQDVSPGVDKGPLKRGVESVGTDGQTKKARVGGKQPTPEEHQRQALELARSVMPGPPAVGPLHLPGQRQMSQEFARPTLEAQRQYSQTQAAYARQQEMAVRQHLANSPQVQGMSPAQMTPSQVTAPSPLGMASPVVNADGSANQGPYEQQTPVTGRSRKSKPGTGLTIDTDADTDMPEATPPGVSAGKRKVSSSKKLPRSVSDKKQGAKSNKVATGSSRNGAGQSSAGDGTVHGDGSPSTQTIGSAQSYHIGLPQTPTNMAANAMSADMGYANGSAPGSTRSQVFQLPSIEGSPAQQTHQSLPSTSEAYADGSMPTQLTEQALQPGQTQAQVQSQMQQEPQQPQQQPQAQQQHQQHPLPQTAFDGNFSFDDTSDFLKNINFGEGLPFPTSAYDSSFNFDDFNFPGLGEGAEEWNQLDTTLPEGS